MRRSLVTPVTTLLLSAAAPSLAQETGPIIRYPAASDFRVLELRLAIPLTPATREGPSVRVYGDGRVVRHRPSYMKRGGDYEAWLSHADLDRLLAFVAEQGLMEFDSKRVKAEHLAARQRLAETGGEPLVVDAPTTILHIDLEAYSPAGVDEITPDFAKTISWYALDSVVSWYPELTSLQELQEVVTVLRKLGERTEAAATEGETTITLADLPAPSP